MVVKDGFRFVQGLIPVRMHKDLTRVSRDFGVSEAEIILQGIALFLQNAKCEKPAKSWD